MGSGGNIVLGVFDALALHIERDLDEHRPRAARQALGQRGNQRLAEIVEVEAFEALDAGCDDGFRWNFLVAVRSGSIAVNILALDLAGQNDQRRRVAVRGDERCNGVRDAGPSGNDSEAGLAKIRRFCITLRRGHAGLLVLAKHRSQSGVRGNRAIQVHCHAAG